MPTTTTCVLKIGERVVVRSNGPPEAEYALFELGDIELRASEPGRVREHGYKTTAEFARTKLTFAGITPALARECANVMHPLLSAAYARGPAARAVARHLSAVELFQSDSYDASSHVYSGGFLDLAALVADLGLPGAGVAFQALYLACLLENEAADTTVFLSTDAFTRLRRPGERTHKRANVAATVSLRNALTELATRPPPPIDRNPLGRSEVTAFLHARAEQATDAETRTLYELLERAVAARDKPERGPLAEAQLWELESRIDAGNFEGLVQSIDDLERASGRSPGTTYLRARAALTLHLEPAKLIAERVSALALSMTSFQELSLLAAEAWLEAGDPRRALPYARDLAESPSVDDGLLLRARRVLTRASSGAPETHKTVTDAPLAPKPPSTPVRARAITEPEAPEEPAPTPQASWPPSASEAPTARGGSIAARASRSNPPPMELEMPETPRATASFTIDLPGPPEAETPKQSAPPRTDSSEPRTSQRRRGMGLVTMESRPPPAFDPRAEPISTDAMPAAPRVAEDPHAQQTPLRPRSPELESPSEAPEDAFFRPRHTAAISSDAQGFASAADARMAARSSGPPISHGPRTERGLGTPSPPYDPNFDRPVHMPKTPLLPDVGGGDNLIEHLAMPEGLDEAMKPSSGLPKSLEEARVYFTLLARELGADYRVKRGLELRCGLAGVEMMQRVLLEMFRDRAVHTEDDAAELRRHGAALSEIMARRLGAEWIDIAFGELGSWGMIVPPNTRVWPFRRVARLVEMGTKERDLVAYYTELAARAGKR